MNIDKKIATRQSYGEALLEVGTKNKNIVVLDADLSTATKTNIFAKQFPERFFDLGIAEQNLIGTAAGMATCGKIPFVSTFAVFAAGRAYDQIRNSICYPNLNVKICATHAGITVGEDGATHQMLEDISLMRTLPNMTVMCTSVDTQTKWAIEEISKIQGPVYLRLCRLASPVIYEENTKFEIGKATQIGDGTDATIFATGITVAESLKAQEMCTDGLLIVTPYYNKCTQNGIYEYYKTIAEAVHIPIICYNVPPRTGVNILPATMERIATLPNIAGVKEACGNMEQICETMRRIRGKCDLYSGDDNLNLPILAIGGAGLISVASNIIPKETKMLYDFMQEHNLAAANEIQDRMLPLIDAMFMEVNPIPAKAAAQMIGLEGGVPRPPLTELEPAHKDQLRKVLTDFGLKVVD